MVRAVLILTVSSMLLVSCGTVRESRLNPFNWFGRSQSEPVEEVEGVNPLIPRRRSSIFTGSAGQSYLGDQVATIRDLRVERRPGGAIIRATGIAAQDGPFDVRMTEVEDEESTTLTFDLRAIQISGLQGGAQARVVTAAVFVSDQDLQGIRTIRVIGRDNARTSRR